MKPKAINREVNVGTGGRFLSLYKSMKLNCRVFTFLWLNGLIVLRCKFIASLKTTIRTLLRLKFSMLYYNTFTRRGNLDTAQAQLLSLNPV